MAGGIRIGLDEVLVHFSGLEDPRSEVNLRHPLESVVVIALMAVLAGASGPTSIARWALIKAELLTTLLPLPPRSSSERCHSASAVGLAARDVSDLLRELVAIVACGGSGGDRH